MRNPIKTLREATRRMAQREVAELAVGQVFETGYPVVTVRGLNDAMVTVVYDEDDDLLTFTRAEVESRIRTRAWVRI